MSTSDPYDTYALFYDELNHHRLPLADHIQGIIYRYAPQASAVLELACGTGAILASLNPAYEFTGLDTSAPMLAVARERLPAAHFVQADMRSFSLGRTFDVIFCTYNSINHLLRPEALAATFAHVAQHLAPEGVWLFDILMREQLEHLAANPSSRRLSDGSVDISVERLEGDLFAWHLARRVRGAPLARATVPVRAYEPAAIEALLAPHFTVLEAGMVGKGDPGRRFYVCRGQ